jgi:hypothetical protein
MKAAVVLGRGRFSQEFAQGVDVELDYLWGKSAERLIAAGAKVGAAAVPIRFVQIGSVTAANVTLPSAALRSSAIVLMGSGIGSIPFDRLVKAIDGDAGDRAGWLQDCRQSRAAVRSGTGLDA